LTVNAEKNPPLPHGRGSDKTPDGRRFLLNVDLSEAAAAPITVLLNWQAGIRK
jgi:hypothetical protein